MYGINPVREALERGREWRAIWDQDAANLRELKERNANMPKALTNKGVRLNRIDTESTRDDLDELYEALVAALDATEAASLRESQLNRPRQDQGRRFPSLGGGAR